MPLADPHFDHWKLIQWKWGRPHAPLMIFQRSMGEKSDLGTFSAISICKLTGWVQAPTLVGDKPCTWPGRAWHVPRPPIFLRKRAVKTTSGDPKGRPLNGTYK